MDLEGPFQAKYPGILRELDGNSISESEGWPRLSGISVGWFVDIPKTPPPSSVTHGADKRDN